MECRRPPGYVCQFIWRELSMKICTVCGTENDSETIRCSVCQAILPETEFLSTPFSLSEENAVKICDRCETVCDKNAIKCTKCGCFLRGSRVYSKVGNTPETTPLTMCVDSGEIITVTAGQVIGRQYQPEIWDAYTPRAFYKVHFTKGHYVLENLKDFSFQPVNYGKSYTIGRKEIRFTIDK